MRDYPISFNFSNGVQSVTIPESVIHEEDRDYVLEKKPSVCDLEDTNKT